MKTDSKTMFATFNPWRLFFAVAIPGMVSMFAMSIYTIFEGIFIGQKLGESVLAAINIAFPVVMINFSLADMIGVGASAPIAISLGKKDDSAANNIFTCSVLLIFATSMLMGFLMFFAAEPLARMMGADDDILGMATKYIQVYAICSPFSTVFFATDNYLRISGYVKMSMVVNIFFNAIMLALLALFLFVFEMDAVGSALATCISMCICAIIALTPFIRRKALLKFVKPHFSVGLIKQIALCGSPVFLNNISGRVTSILMNISLMTLGLKYLGDGGGTTAVAAYGILMYASEMGQPLLYGMSDSLAPALGFNWGAKKYDRVKKIAQCGYIGTCIASVASAAIMFFFSDAVVSLFVDKNDTALLNLSAHALKLFSFTFVFRWFIIATQSFLSAIEKPVHATIMSTAVALVFPVIMLGALWSLGLDGIWLNMCGTAVLASILGIILIVQVIRKVKME